MKQNSLEERKKLFQQLMSIHPNKIPFIIDKSPDFPGLKDITKNKFLLYKEISFQDFYNMFIEKYLELKLVENNSFLIVKFYTPDKKEIQKKGTLLDIYEEYKEEDGFVYLKYSYEYVDKEINSKLNKEDIEKFLVNYPNKIPIILMEHPSCQNSIELIKYKFLLDKGCKVEDLINNLNIKFNDNNIAEDKKGSIKLMPTTNSTPLQQYEKICDIFNKYKDNYGVLYLYCSYENQSSNFKPENKKFNVILQKNPKYPQIKEIKINSYLIEPEMNIANFRELILQQLYDMNEKDISYLGLKIKINDKEINDDDNFLKLFNQYKSSDEILYLYYSYSYITEFEYKKKYTLEERKIKYNELKGKYPNKNFIIFQKEIDINDNNKDNNSEDIILFFEPNEEIDSVKMKLWNKIGKPFMKIELMNDKNHPILKDIKKIKDLYNKFKDNEDNFLYLLYRLVKPKFENEDYGDGKNLKLAKKIFLLFNMIPFVFKPAPNFANSSVKQKVFLPYKNKDSTFNELQTDKKYKYYIEYPDKIVDPNEKMVDFYLNNRNENDEFLYLTMTNEL